MYHPAAALRASSLKQTMLEDMAGMPQVLIDARARREPPTVTLEPVPETEQIPEPLAVPIEPETEIELEAALAVVAALPEPVADDNQTTLFG